MAANDYSMGKYMQSQQNPCKLDGLGKSKYRAGQKMNINQMICVGVSLKQVNTIPIKMTAIQVYFK